MTLLAVVGGRIMWARDSPVSPAIPVTYCPSCAFGSVQIGSPTLAWGVSSEALERRFQRFVSTKAEDMGTGLSVCHTIVEAHGGRPWLEPRRDGTGVL
jgi:hypothetical protein